LLAACGGPASTHSAARQSTAQRQPGTTQPQASALASLSVTHAGVLPAAVQDPATTSLGGHALLVGGLDSSDASVGDVLLAAGGGANRIGSVANPLHDAAAATLYGRAYVFGGGEPSRSGILAIAPDGRTSSAGALPVGASDVGAAGVGATAYIVGGYNGADPLDTILAWQGSGTAHVVARLPHPLRYAAVTAAAGQLIIAGGTSGTNATREIYAFDPAASRVRPLALLPHPLTHAAAATLRGVVYVIGGRGSVQGSQTAEILAVDPVNGRIQPAGRLPKPLSDVGAAVTGDQILLGGGRGATGVVSDELLLLTGAGR
jgi:hypothetical protein